MSDPVVVIFLVFVGLAALVVLMLIILVPVSICRAVTSAQKRRCDEAILRQAALKRAREYLGIAQQVGPTANPSLEQQAVADLNANNPTAMIIAIVIAVITVASIIVSL